MFHLKWVYSKPNNLISILFELYVTDVTVDGGGYGNILRFGWDEFRIKSVKWAMIFWGPDKNILRK